MDDRYISLDEASTKTGWSTRKLIRGALNKEYRLFYFYHSYHGGSWRPMTPAIIADLYNKVNLPPTINHASLLKTKNESEENDVLEEGAFECKIDQLHIDFKDVVKILNSDGPEDKEGNFSDPKAQRIFEEGARRAALEAKRDRLLKVIHHAENKGSQLIDKEKKMQAAKEEIQAITAWLQGERESPTNGDKWIIKHFPPTEDIEQEDVKQEENSYEPPPKAFLDDLVKAAEQVKTIREAVKELPTKPQRKRKAEEMVDQQEGGFNFVMVENIAAKWWSGGDPARNALFEVFPNVAQKHGITIKPTPAYRLYLKHKERKPLPEEDWSWRKERQK